MQRDASVTRWTVVRLVTGVVLTVGSLVPLALITVLVVRAATGPASSDPHGYTVIFGVVFGVMLLVPLLIGLTLLVPVVVRQRRR